MDGKIGKAARKELLGAVRVRYEKASKTAKSKILDEVVALGGFHRKTAIRLLTMDGNDEKQMRVDRRVYDDAVREALIVIWEASDRICGKRLKALLPTMVKSMESHGHLQLDSNVRKRLLEISAATIDRLLAPVRSQAGKRKKRRRRTKPSKSVPVRTFDDWSDSRPGYLEIDFVVHCGGQIAGTYVHSLVATDVCSAWTEAVPLLVREQSLVTEGLSFLRGAFPFQVDGINSDNDSAFINDTLVSYCQKESIAFTRSRPYRKNDQAWIEQKNGAIIRKFVGYERFSGVVAAQVLAQLYQAVRLYVNFFQPSFKLLQKLRDGSKVKKTYLPPATPCDRLLTDERVSKEIREALRSQREQLDPMELLHRIRKTQTALASLASNNGCDENVGEDLDGFIAQLPRLWKAGEVRPTHRREPKGPRDWRTRKDPFERVWPEVLVWLQEEPEATAKSLFKRLQESYPNQFPDGQLRTLQRRFRDWRQMMARELVFSGAGEQACTVVGDGEQQTETNFALEDSDRDQS
jgi:hypothetical protein